MSKITKIGVAAFKKYGEHITLQQLAQAESEGLWKDPEIEQWMLDNEKGCQIHSFGGFMANKIGYKRVPPKIKKWLDRYIQQPVLNNKNQLNIKEMVRAKWRWEADHNMFHGDWTDEDMVERASEYYSLNLSDITLHFPENYIEKINQIKNTKETHTEKSS